MNLQKGVGRSHFGVLRNRYCGQNTFLGIFHCKLSLEFGVASIHGLPISGLLGNPYAAGRILMRLTGAKRGFASDRHMKQPQDVVVLDKDASRGSA